MSNFGQKCSINLTERFCDLSSLVDSQSYWKRLANWDFDQRCDVNL